MLIFRWVSSKLSKSNRNIKSWWNRFRSYRYSNKKAINGSRKSLKRYDIWVSRLRFILNYSYFISRARKVMIFYYSKQTHMPSIEISTEIDYSIDGNTTSTEEPIDYPPSSSVRRLDSIILFCRLIIAQLQQPQKRRLQLLSFLLLV